MVIDGKKIASEIITKLKTQPIPQKILAAVLVGENPASISFLKQKERVAKELGVDFRIYRFPEEIKNDDLRKEVGKIALLKPVGGVIVQLPLPIHLNRHYILNVIPREKDVDVLGERALGAFYAGRNPVLPPAVGTVIEILREPAALFEKNVSEAEQSRCLSEAKASEAERSSGVRHAGADNHVFSKIKPLAIAVIGLGFLVGKPIATWLIGKCPEIYLLGRGSDLKILKQADLIISGVGQAGIIKPEMLKENAGVIDFGYSIENGSGIMNNELRIKIRGDLDVSDIHNSGFYTPTPGGTGPILVTKIFENFYRLLNKE
ncbi:MAG: bifunctional 5,10-methylenetetrahydrofolate dehydrogenase/5,10-methenyltetrahydrofolate cyclohydrolase [bacterium]|nr:bifunctional 5,10-methylenetetrahydrofolate dehydrogenase/5,10-methenyltetrahydrofolate cyclohydrolase [bacterium]